jgi:hypothetical protein
LVAVCWLSLAYDAGLGLALLFFQPQVVSVFGLPPPNYPVNGNLNGLFALAIGLGYLAPIGDPERHRWYVWLMGAGLKSTGPLVFFYDVFARGGPSSFLWFALSDGLLALASLWALISSTSSSGGPDGRAETASRPDASG